MYCHYSSWLLVKVIAVILGIVGSMILFGGDGLHTHQHHSTLGHKNHAYVYAVTK